MTPWSTFNERRQIQAFIQADPAVITIKRRPKVATDAGGYKLGVEQSLAPQTFRLVPFKRRLTHGTSAGGGAGEGRVASLPYVLVGRHDADVQAGDYFDYGGLRYEVVSIAPDTEFRKAAELIEKGASGG